jgi:hypothetical protein
MTWATIQKKPDYAANLGWMMPERIITDIGSLGISGK